MTTDLIIGMASGYNWDVLRPFVVSLRRHYQGRCVLIFGEGPKGPRGRHEPDPPGFLEEKLKRYNIEVLDIGNFVEHPHLFRFYVIASFLRLEEDLRYVIAVDTSDIVFQADPMNWLANNLGESKIVVVSEGVTFKNCPPWKATALEAFNHDVYYSLAKEEVCNAGVIAGTAGEMRKLLFEIYQMSRTDERIRRFGVVEDDEMAADQVVLNYLLRQPDWAGRTKIATVGDNFVFGTHHMTWTPSLRYVFDTCDPGQEHEMHLPGKQSFPIFHQYIWVKEWRQHVREKYQESEPNA